MKSALLVAAILGTAHVASAGAYVGLGIGPTPAVSDALDAQIQPDGRSLRLGGGYRFANLSVEGAITGVNGLETLSDEKIYVGWGAGKLSIPLGSGFEVFGRVGLNYQSTSVWYKHSKAEGDQLAAISGTGFLVGAGFEYNLNLVATKLSLYVDYNLAHAKLENADALVTPVDNTVRQWTLGFSVGL